MVGWPHWRPQALEVRYAAVIAANAVCLLAAFALQDWGLMPVLVAFSFVHFSTQPLENTLIARYTSHEARGMSFAVSCAISFGMGALGAWAGFSTCSCCSPPRPRPAPCAPRP